jgi:hypothetical protein
MEVEQSAPPQQHLHASAVEKTEREVGGLMPESEPSPDDDGELENTEKVRRFPHGLRR